MNLLGNIIWIIFGGFVTAIGWFIAGLFCCVTIIGIPLGIQCFKVAKLTFAPFGKEVAVELGFFSLLGNIIWILIFGWELFVIHIIFGFLFTITIVGIPFGKQHFKIALLALFPFGAKLN